MFNLFVGNFRSGYSGAFNSGYVPRENSLIKWSFEAIKKMVGQRYNTYQLEDPNT